MVASTKKINLIKAFLLAYFSVYATSPVLVHLHTKMHNELYASPSAKIGSPARAWELILPELFLSILTGEERNDTGDPTRGDATLNRKVAEISESVQSKLRSPLISSPGTPVEVSPSERSALTTTTQHRPKPQKGFYPFYCGLSPPSL